LYGLAHEFLNQNRAFKNFVTFLIKCTAGPMSLYLSFLFPVLTFIPMIGLQSSCENNELPKGALIYYWIISAIGMIIGICMCTIFTIAITKNIIELRREKLSVQNLYSKLSFLIDNGINCKDYQEIRSLLNENRTERARHFGIRIRSKELVRLATLKAYCKIMSVTITREASDQFSKLICMQCENYFLQDEDATLIPKYHQIFHKDCFYRRYLNKRIEIGGDKVEEEFNSLRRDVYEALDDKVELPKVLTKIACKELIRQK